MLDIRNQPLLCKGLHRFLLRTHFHTQPELPHAPVCKFGLLQAGVYEDEQDLGQPFEEATWSSHGQQVPNQSHHAGEKPCKH